MRLSSSSPCRSSLLHRGSFVCLLACFALSACGGALRTSTIRGHRVFVDASRGDARTTLRIDECAARELHYDTDFARWGLLGELDGALFESPEEAADQLITAGYASRCAPARAASRAAVSASSP